MASSEEIFNPDIDKLFQLNLVPENADATLSEKDYIKYGQIDAWLTSSVFNLNQARAVNASQVIEEAKKLQLNDTATDSAVKDVHQSCCIVLPKMILSGHVGYTLLNSTEWYYDSYRFKTRTF